MNNKSNYLATTLRKTLLPVLLGFAFQMQAQADGSSAPLTNGLVNYVNILQGTDSHPDLSHGNTLPLVGMPWGMIDWSLENTDGRWFFAPNGKTDGFRATHQPSPWIADYGQFTLMPQSGELRLNAPDRLSDYDTTTAVLRPDYEKLDLKKDQITAELTATERGAVFRFSYHQGQTGRLILEASGSSEIKVEGRTIRGFSRANNGGVPTNFASYFAIQLDRDITKADIYINHTLTNGTSGSGDTVQCAVEFKTAPDDPALLQVGTSLISGAQAERNLHAETEGGFDAVHTRVQKTWEASLGRVEIDTTDTGKKTFYSCLYHAQMFPHRLYELDAAGRAIHYSPYDGKVHDGVLYGDIGIWDAFRTTFPLITLLYPAQLNEILQGFVNAATEGGTLPEWPSPGYRDCMIGQHCAAIFADAIVKGQRGFDTTNAYASLLQSAFQPPAPGVLVRRGLDDYINRGYIPDGASTYAVSATLDYAYDDWCVAQIAQAQNHPDDYNKLMARAQNYRHVWDAGTGFMRPKDAAGQWVEPFDQFAWGGPYAEGGPWQDSWFVPHDTAGLARLLGGPDKLAAKLDAMLGLPPVYHTSADGYHDVIHEMREMGIVKFGQYDQGNQPGFDSLYLFAAIGQPWQTEYWTRRVCTELFSAEPNGFPGDEDNGSMSSWYLLSSIGLYPLCPGTPQYLYTSPLFTRIVLHLPDSKTFTITAPQNSGDNVYVQKRQLNGVEDSRTFLNYQDIMQGGALVVELGPTARTTSVSTNDLPYSASPY